MIDKIRVCFSELIVLRIIDYDNKYYIVEAVKSVEEPNFNDPFYAVNKSTYEISSFIPALNIDGFMEAIEKRTIYKNNKVYNRPSN